MLRNRAFQLRVLNHVRPSVKPEYLDQDILTPSSVTSNRFHSSLSVVPFRRRSPPPVPPYAAHQLDELQVIRGFINAAKRLKTLQMRLE
ncbi:hypothetical protein QL285_026763 [Trifolium repens]|nr:hypothetical protein QL285_026763 [Trifolium repens]